MKRLLVTLALLATALPMLGATRTWTGAVDNNWSNAANWGGTAPVAGDDLVFPAGAQRLNSMNDDLAAGTSFSSISTSGSNVMLQGNAFTIGSGGITVAANSALSITNTVTLGASQTWTVGTNGVLAFGTAVDVASHTLTASGGGLLLFNNAAINGTTGAINANVALVKFLFNTVSYSGATTVGSGATLQEGGGAFAGPVVINSGGTLDELGFTVHSSNVSILAGATLHGTIQSAASYSRMTANGTVTLGGTLNYSLAAAVPNGTVLTLINNSAATPTVGTFAGLPEGATVNIGGQNFTISYVGGSGNDVTLTAGAPPTATTLNLNGNPNPSTYGQSVTITATITPSPNAGTVTFSENGATLGTAPVSGNTASISVSNLLPGSHTIDATYSGGGTFGPSSGSMLQTVNKANPTVMLTSNGTPSSVGQSVTFTATLTPSTAIGNVEFYDGATLLATRALSGGVATYQTSALAAGPHSMTAKYLGDFANNPATSNVFTQTVNAAAVATTTTLNVSPASPVSNSPVTFTANVSPSGATGNVAFYDGATLLGNGTLSNGVATFSTTLPAGNYNVTAQYAGDTTHSPSSSAPQSFAVVNPTAVPFLSPALLIFLAAFLAVAGAFVMRR